MSRPVRALADLFVKLFDEGELREFLAGEMPHDVIPGAGKSLATFAFEAADTLLRRIPADRALFDRLEDARPKRVAEIRRTRSQVVPDSPLEPGVVWCDGRYRLDERLGAGGFAEVWRATDLESKMYVALKILHAHLADDRLARTRFVRGAQALTGLHHPGLVAVHLAEGREGSRLYHVMDLVDGTSLIQTVEQRAFERSMLLELLGQVGETLVYVHAQGLVHRDVGPHNILIGSDGKARLVDFDLVGGDKFERLTMTKPIGALPYLAPELIDGRAAPTSAADVYGLAMTTLFVLVGVERWSNDAALRNTDDLLAHAPSDAALHEVLRAALQRDPQRRTQTVAEFCAALRSASGRAQLEPAQVAPEFTEDGALRLWSPPPPELPQHLVDAGVELWPAEAVERAIAGGLRSAAALAKIVPHVADLTRVATVLALRGHRPAWLGVTRNHTAVLVCPRGHVVLYDSGPPGADELKFARRYAPVGIPAAIVDAWPGERPRDVAVLAEEIRRGVHDEPRWRSLARFTRSVEVYEAFEQIVHVSGDVTSPVMDALLGWLAGPPSIAALRGPIGAGRSHVLGLFAAHLADGARIGSGTPVVFARARRWRAPLRLSEVLTADGYTAVEVAAIRFALASGECVLVLDDLDAPDQPMADRHAYNQVEEELEAWAGENGHIIVAMSPTFAVQVEHVFHLVTPIDPALSHLAEVMSERLSPDSTRRISVQLGTISLLQLPRLGRALVNAAREHGDLGPVRLLPAIEQYLHSWTEQASLHAPGATAEQYRLALETIAAAVWQRYPGLDGKALTRTEVDELLHDGGRAGRVLARALVDGAILTPARQNTRTDAWLAAERERLLGTPRERWRPHGERADERDPDAVYFAHNTLLEVLLASHLARELADGRLEVLGGPRPSPNLCALVYATPHWQRARAVIEAVLTADYRPGVSEQALLLAIPDPTLKSSPERPWRLSGARLDGAALRGARLAGCDFVGAELHGADLHGADLRGACLDGADLSRADLRGVSLAGASAADARLIGARLDGVDARGSNLRSATLFASSAERSPDLTDADLAGADLDATLWSAPIGLERAVSGSNPRHCWSTTPGSFRDDARDVTELLSPRALGWMNDVAWMPDGRALVSISNSGHVILWSARPLRPIRRWRAAAFGATRLAISGDGRLLVTWTEGQAANLWDMASGEEVYPGALAGVPLSSAAWARTSTTLALFAPDGTTWLWTPDQDVPRRLASAAPGPANGAFLPGDDRLLRATATGFVELLHLSTDCVEARNSEHKSSGFGFAVAPDGRRVALKDFHKLALVDITNGLVSDYVPDIRQLAIDPAIDWSPDGEHLVLGYGHGQHGVAIWNVGARRWSHHLDADRGRWHRLRFSPDGTWVVGVGWSGQLFLWDARTGRRLEQTTARGGWIAGAALSPDRRTLLAFSDDKLRIWSLPHAGAHEGRTLVENELVCPLPDGSGVVVAREGMLLVEDLRGTRRRVLDRSVRRGAGAWLNGHFTCDRRILVCRVEDDPRREIAAWEVASGRKVLERPLVEDVSTLVYQTYAADVVHGIGICAGQYEGKAAIDLSLPDARMRRLVDSEQCCIYQLAVNAGGTLLASASDRPIVSVWDLRGCVEGPDEVDAKKARLALFALEGGLVDRLLFAPQGLTLAVACGDSVSLFDVATWARTHRLDGHGFRIHCLDFSADGRLLVAGDWSGQVSVWRVDTGALVFRAHSLPETGGLVTRGARHTGSDDDVRGWYAQLGYACVPARLFGGALADPDGIACELARELEIVEE